MTTDTNGRELLTADEAAAQLHLQTSTLLNMGRRGTLPFYQIGHRRLFAPADIQALVDARRRQRGSMNDKALPPLTGKDAGRSRKPAQ